MNIDLDVLEEIIKEQILKEWSANRLAAAAGDRLADKAPKYDKQMYFDSNPGLKEKWEKAYSNPNWKKNADKHDREAIQFNKDNLRAIRRGRIKPKLTSVQKLGNDAIDEWYKSTSAEDRAMKTYSGEDSARAKFYDQMRRKSAAAGEEVDIAGMDDDDVFSQEPAGFRNEDPLGLSGQRQFKFQKDIIGRPGEKGISMKDLKDRSGDFQGASAADLGISPEAAGTIEDIGTTLMPTKLTDIPAYAVGGPIAGKALGKAGSWALSKAGQKVMQRRLVKMGVPKARANTIVKRTVEKKAKEKAAQAAQKALNKNVKLSSKLKPDAKFLSTKSPTLSKAMKGLKNVQGFKPNAWMKDPAWKGLGGGTAKFLNNMLLTKGGGGTITALYIAGKGCGKNRACEEGVMGVLRDNFPEELGKLSDAQLRIMQRDAIKAGDKRRDNMMAVDASIKNSKGGNSKDPNDKIIKNNQEKIIKQLELSPNASIDPEELKSYFGDYRSEYRRSKMGSWPQFLKRFKEMNPGVTFLDPKKLEEQAERAYQSHKNNIIESVLYKLGY